MADDIDRAQEREQQDRERAIDAARSRVEESFKPRDPSVANFCLDCDEAIEPERLRALSFKTSRCASCAHRHAKDHRVPAWVR